MIDRIVYYFVAGITFVVFVFIGVYKVPRKAIKKTRRMMRRDMEAPAVPVGLNA